MALREPKENAVHSWEAVESLDYFLNIDVEAIMVIKFDMTVLMKVKAIWLLGSFIRRKKKEKEKKNKREESRGRIKRHEKFWHKRENFLHLARDRGNSKKSVCVLTMNTAFGDCLNKE